MQEKREEDIMDDVRSKVQQAIVADRLEKSLKQVGPQIDMYEPAVFDSTQADCSCDPADQNYKLTCPVHHKHAVILNCETPDELQRLFLSPPAWSSGHPRPRPISGLIF